MGDEIKMEKQMRKAIVGLFIIGCLTSCTQRTEFGECIGLVDEKNPALKYDISIWNGVVATFLSGTVVVPVWTLAKQIQCPSGKK